MTLQAQLNEDYGDDVVVRFEITDTGIGISPESQDLQAVRERWLVPATPAVDRSSSSQVGPSDLNQAAPTPTGTSRFPLSVFDPQTMLGNIGGDRHLQDELIMLFLTRRSAVLKTAAEALATHDYATLERTAHSAKGTASNLCAKELTLAARAWKPSVGSACRTKLKRPTTRLNAKRAA